MKTVNIHEAKTHLSRLVEEASAGTEIVIAKAGRPIARLVPARSMRARELGVLAGKLVVPEDFDEALPSSVLDSFEGRGHARPR